MISWFGTWLQSLLITQSAVLHRFCRDKTAELRQEKSVMNPRLLKNIGFLTCCFLLSGCTSEHFPRIENMLVHVSNEFPNIYRLVTATSYIMGIAFIFRGIYQLKVYGDLRTMMSVQTNFKATMMVFFAGTALLYAPTAFKSMLLSTFATTSITDPMSYQSAKGIWSPLASQAVLRFIQLIGTISFIRGWVHLTHVSNPNGRSTMGKAVTHIIAGLLAVNIEGTREMLQASFGIT
jgi:intracellular multiplication protein IcmC